jgi:hypothetical protein
VFCSCREPTRRPIARKPLAARTRPRRRRCRRSSNARDARPTATKSGRRAEVVGWCRPSCSCEVPLRRPSYSPIVPEHLCSGTRRRSERCDARRELLWRRAVRPVSRSPCSVYTSASVEMRDEVALDERGEAGAIVDRAHHLDLRAGRRTATAIAPSHVRAFVDVADVTNPAVTVPDRVARRRREREANEDCLIRAGDACDVVEGRSRVRQRGRRAAEQAVAGDAGSSASRTSGRRCRRKTRAGSSWSARTTRRRLRRARSLDRRRHQDAAASALSIAAT